MPHDPAKASDPSAPATIADVEAGLQFSHRMELQGRREQHQLAVESSALVDLLIAKGVISARELDERRQTAEAQQARREGEHLFPQFSPPVDKYKVESPPIPCAENLHLCHAACCSMAFNLSVQDLDEGKVRWDFARPYRVRQLADGHCTHLSRDDGSCTIYECRPAVCRSYDCRRDPRIWVDYEKRIPNPALTSASAP
jgi:Fe-S-cluster containining protein